MNTDLFKKVYAQISEHPETHDQRDWESECATKRCVAGWALYFINPDQDIFKTAHDLGYDRLKDAAQEVLGLSRSQADQLFLGTENRIEALDLLKSYAGLD